MPTPPRPVPYTRADVRADVLAGCTLGVILVPQAMAYGLLAGVEPVYGLYAALVPLVVYGLFSTTPHVSVGPTALASLLCLNGLSGVVDVDSPHYLTYALTLAGLTGVIQLLFGALRLGGIVNLLSRPVLSGFVSAAAVLIMVSQLDALLGVEVERAAGLHWSLWYLAGAVADLHAPSLLLGVGSLLALIAGKRYLPRRVPLMLLLIVLTTVLIAVGGNRWGVAIVGDIPAGLPGVFMPSANLDVITELLPVAGVLALISFVETLSIGKTFSPRYAYYRVSPNRESIALGLSKVVGMFFFAIPTSASFSRSAVVEAAGARGWVAGLTAAGLLLLTLLFLTPAFYFLPIPVLAAVIVFSVRRLFDWRAARELSKLAPKELVTLLVTFFFTLFAGLQWGIAGGVVLSLVFVFLRAARPQVAELGRVPGTNAFRNTERFAEAAVDPAILIVRFDAELYFGNAAFFRDRLQRLIDGRADRLRHLVIDAHTINDLDTTGLFVLRQLYDELTARGVELHLCGVIGPVRDLLFRSGMMEEMGADHNFLSIQDALRFIGRAGGERGWDSPAVQHD